MAPAFSFAGSYLLINSGNSEIYTRFEHRLKTSLSDIDKTNSLVTRNVKTFTSHSAISDFTEYDAVISAGIEASIAISNSRINNPRLMAMVPRQSFNQLSTSGDISCKPANCHVIYLGQPVNRQLRLIKLALPNTKQIAVISSRYSAERLKEISDSATQFGININHIKAANEDSVLTELNQNLSKSDMLMAIPDPVVFNRNTARAILLSAFHQHIPLFAYSRSFVRAGATLGIYSTPEDIAQHVAELISHNSSISAAPHALYPKYFTIDINRRAADALDISIPDRQYLEKRLKTDE